MSTAGNLPSSGGRGSQWSDIQDGNHCATRSEWRTPLQQNIQKFLVRTGSAAGAFRISSRKAGNLAEWRDWQTPTLADGPTTPPSTPPTTPPSTPPTTPPTTPPAGGGCAAAATINQWTGGFTATVRVTAGSSPVNSWTVTMTLPAGATITNTWNADPSGTTGTVRFTNVAYNGALAPGQSTEFGFQSTGTGTGLTPTCAAR